MWILAELKRRNVLRVVVAYLAAAWFLIQIADTVFAAYGLPDSAVAVLITILAIGLVPAVILSWAFELTPEGLKRDAGLAPGVTPVPGTGRALDRAIMVVLALAIGFFAVDKFILDPARDTELAEQVRSEALVESYGDKSIAVLPFVNMSSDPEQDYFSDGVSEEILNLLAKIRELRVISRSSAFALREETNIREVAEQLGVSYVLEGSVRTSGDQVRITAQLIDARTDTHIWSDTFDRTKGNIFDLQDEIAGIVASELQLRLLSGHGKYFTTDPESYSLYLRARYSFYGDAPDSQDLQSPFGMLETVLQRDPNYVPAMLLLAHISWYVGRDGERSAENIQKRQQELIRRAYALAPNHGVANAYMAWLALAQEHDARAAARFMEQALEADPTDLEVLRLSAVLTGILQYDAASLQLASRTLTRDLLCAQCFVIAAGAHMALGQRDEAREVLQRRMDLVGDAGAHYQLAYWLQETGDPAAALEIFQRYPEHGADSLFPQVLALHDLGRQDEADRILQQLLLDQGDEAAPAFAITFAHLGNAERVLFWAQRLVETDPETFLLIYREPAFKLVRDDPAWIELRQRMGVADEQLALVDFRLPDLGPLQK